jgi:acyl dehydratase
MSLCLEAVGVTGPPSRFVVDAASIAAYKRVVGAELFYAALPLTEAVQPVLERLASPEAQARMVHFAHDLRVRRPLRDGDDVTTTAAPLAVLPVSTGTLASIRTETRSKAGALVNEQLLTVFFVDVFAAAPAGQLPPRPPETEATADADRADVALPADLPARYADVSGDRNAIHLDDDAARKLGLPGRVVHGLCSLALAVAATGAENVSRATAQFGAPLQPGSMEVASWRDSTSWRFEARCGGATVLRNGLIESS